VKRERLTIRRAPTGIAGLLQELELRQPTVVTTQLLTEVISESGSHLSVEAAAERLVREGWLSPVRTRGSWEFVPASRAGAYPSGDPWIELRALLARKPESPVAIAFASAVWEHGYSTHQPTRQTFAHAPGWRPPRALSEARAVSYEWRLPPWQKNHLPVWHAATLAVAVAHRPACQDDWGNAEEWLPEVLRAISASDVLVEVRDRGAATIARLGHLAEWSGRNDIVEALRPLLPERLSVSYLGPREPRGRWVGRWRLYDSLLPSR
jgi:AbiEi antitoxin C-terminal domain